MSAHKMLKEKKITKPQTLETIRQNTEIEDFVYDFLRIWITINEKAKNASFEHILSISQELLNSHVNKFYDKYQHEGNFVKQAAWIKNYASIGLRWDKKGGFFLPLKLVTYEVAYHKKRLLDTFLRGLLTKQIKGTRRELYNYLFPKLLNFTAPLDEVDILILKSYQSLLTESENFYRLPTQTDFANKIDMSVRSVIRRLEKIRILQIVNSIMFVEMGKLGYETSILFHSNDFPKEYEKYLLISSDHSIGKFSLVQIPYELPKETMELHEKLDMIFSQQLSRRLTNWNLSGLSEGEELWKTLPDFFYSDPNKTLVTPTPTMDSSLIPTFETFRKLTPADIKILDFFITTGFFRSINQLSKAIKVSPHQINHRLKEYMDNKLITKTFQFFNIGLDIPVVFFISDEESTIPWKDHLVSLPKIDLFFQEEERPYFYYGYLRLPCHWIKDFVKIMDLIRKDYGIKIYHKIISPIDYFKWGISLAETYPNKD